MDSNVINTLTGSDKCYLINENELLSDNPNSFTATINRAEKVYNLFPGKVLFLGVYKGMNTVSVKVSPYEVIRYLNLTDVKVWFNSELDIGDEIGSVYPKAKLQFEYCTSDPDTTIYPVRIDDDTYYKQNPIGIFQGTLTPDTVNYNVQGLLRSTDKVLFTEEQKYEWGERKQVTYGTYPGPSINLKDVPAGAIDELSNNL